jgi:two-component system, NarL family, sensor kinase
MAIALGAMRASGELTAAQALGRLRREAPAAVHTAAAAVALTAAAIVVAFGPGDELGPYELLALMGLGLAIATCAALGALVLAARPGHRLGHALLGGGALGSLWTLATVTVDAAGTGEPLGRWAAWLDNWTFVGLLVLVTWPLLLFPDGGLPSRRWRPVAGLLALALTGLALRGMLDPGALDEIDGAVPNPLGIPAGWSWINALGVFGFGIPLAVVAGMVAVQVRARRRPEPAMRAALWASRGLAANFVLCLALNLTDSPLADGAFYAATLTTSIGAFAATAAVTILRDRAVEVDLLLRRAFIVAGVAVGTLLAFLAVFALATSLAGSSESTLGGGLAAALVVVPLRVRVRDRVDRALYGHRDPSTAVQRLGEQLELADEPADALPGVAHALRETLGASGVRIEPDPVVALAPAAAGAELHEPSLERTVSHRGLRLGRLIVGARAPGERYGPADLALAEILVRQLALVLDALRMAAEVQHSREAIVTAREEERRRLRRELHDGLGSALAGIALTLQAAHNAGGPRGDELVEGAREQTEAAVADVRRIVRGLRPPMLEDLGLAAALRAHADRLAPLEVELILPPALPALPAAVELALYRIATEALTNAVRHAHARRCRVELHATDDEAVLEIADDGPGLAPEATAGVGLRSMRERAAELGGRVELSSPGEGGLLLRVRLPLARA